jgi:hypothetical protein
LALHKAATRSAAAVKPRQSLGSDAGLFSSVRLRRRRPSRARLGSSNRSRQQPEEDQRQKEKTGDGRGGDLQGFHAHPRFLAVSLGDFQRQTESKPAEVEAAIRNSSWQPAELGRLECRKDFPYGRDWNGEFYATKQVRPVFVDEAAEIVVVTVHTYYF